ncbi:MAG: tRNA (guanosine(46)-N7)-methyltransferase TrmB [Lachnospiraceae bacterium]|nr:tRNA (guanosine(46)-N7)-methyltransferase TrmB [Lachnospiraceae bacterium]
MRLRHNPKADIAIENSRFVEKNPMERKGRWKELFGNDNPIHIEIGMGKGHFLTTLAQQNPDINYIGIERVATVLYKAERKQQELNLENLILIAFNAEKIDQIFDKNEIERIYLNFSDPWPKDRHAMRRLTSPKYLEMYNSFLSPEGYIAFKTDNRPLFDYSLETAPLSGWKVRDITYDLHNSEYMEGNIMTEYEMKFSAEGVPINRMVIYR